MAGGLMYGGDWPITVTAGGYQHTWAVLAELMDELTDGERARLLSGTAAETYGFGHLLGPADLEHTKGR